MFYDSDATALSDCGSKVAEGIGFDTHPINFLDTFEIICL